MTVPGITSPCPNCLSTEAVFVDEDHDVDIPDHRVLVTCGDCADHDAFGRTREEAIAAWNREMKCDKLDLDRKWGDVAP